MNQPILIERFFIRSAAVVLSAAALAKVYSAFGSARILSATDPIIRLKYWQVMIASGLFELALAAFLLRGRDPGIKLCAVLWLSANFLIYRVANEILHIHVCPCLGTVVDALHLTRKQSAGILQFVVLYLFLGSAFFLASSWYKLYGADATPLPAPARGQT